MNTDHYRVKREFWKHINDNQKHKGKEIQKPIANFYIKNGARSSFGH
jgi:hypothetical protein